MTDRGRKMMTGNAELAGGDSDRAARPVIGMLVSVLSDAYTQALVHGVADGAVEHDANLVIYQLDGPDFGDTGLGAYALVDPALLSGVILTPGLRHQAKRAQDQLQAFVRRCGAIPVHSVSMAVEGVSLISVDDYSGMCSAVEHLLDHHGLRRLAFITGPESFSQAESRYKGYVDTLQRYGLSLDPELVVEGDFSSSGGMRAAIDLLDRGVEMDAVVCANDETAVGVLEALERRQIRVPEDLAVVGFGDAETSRTLVSPLTTVKQPVHELGRRAVEHLLATIAEQKVPTTSAIRTDLVIRRSCGCLPTHVQDLVLAGEAAPQRLITYEDYRPDIVMALQEIVADAWDSEGLIDALWRDVKAPESSGFVTLISAQLHQAVLTGTEVMIWHAVLSKLRQMVVPLLGERRLWYRTEDLLQQARALVDDARLQAMSRRQTLLDLRQLTIQEFTEHAANLMSFEDAVEWVSGTLPKLRVRQCYLSFYDDGSASEVHLLLTYRDGIAQFHGEGQSFAVAGLVPDSVWATLAERYTVLALPLHVGDQSLGMALFEGDLEDLDIYRRLGQSLSGVLFRTQLSDAQRAARQDAERAATRAEQALQDALAAQRRYVESPWQAYGATTSGYHWSPGEGALARDAWLPVMTDAVRESRLAVTFDEKGGQMLGLPLMMLDEEIIGALGFKLADGEPWTSEQLAQVVVVAKELGQILETRRLVADVERRASRLAAAAAVSSAASSITDLGQLLSTSVDLIKDRFALTYAGIFLVDDSREWAVLVAGTGEAGRTMLSREHRLEVDGQSMIGSCITRAMARVVADTALEDDWIRNPLLPNTRSELALPLLSRAEVIGAMTIQDEHPGAFQQADITTLQTMANQLANAIQNARLMERMEQNLREVQMATGRFTESAWREFVHGRRGALGYRHQLLGSSAVADRRPEADEALARGESVVELLTAGDGQGPSYSARAGLGVPIRLRNQILGVLNLRFEDDSVPPEMIRLVEQVADRLAVSLETARLLEETQKTAQRERLLGDLSRRIRQSLDVDEVLQGAVREIREAMDLHRVSVRLAPHTPVRDTEVGDTVESGDCDGSGQ